MTLAPKPALPDDRSWFTTYSAGISIHLKKYLAGNLRSTKKDVLCQFRQEFSPQEEFCQLMQIILAVVATNGIVGSTLAEDGLCRQPRRHK